MLRCASLHSLQQGVLRKVRIALGRLVAGVTQHLADGEQIDTAVDHETGGAVPQIMDPQSRQVRRFDRHLPAVLDRHEGLPGVDVRHQPRTALEARQGRDDRQRRGGQRDVT